ncbi:hypothetical protein [Kamptonema formosum]|uniref:hypothetical protein n=1 Tax=Kamptonema formosum TaxID=331992 RepID=UPI00036041CC|nr:hypothetical protein [Oscillatoria sp. PCC 10802]
MGFQWAAAARLLEYHFSRFQCTGDCQSPAIPATDSLFAGNPRYHFKVETKQEAEPPYGRSQAEPENEINQHRFRYTGTHHNVCRLDIPVPQLLLASSLQRFANLPDLAHRFALRYDAAIAQALPQVFPFYLFHFDARQLPLINSIFNLYDMGEPAQR